MATKKVYEGEEPYAFVSYCHKDTDTVIRYIAALQAVACNLWYDIGIHAGTHWSNEIAAHLEGARCVIFFVTKNSVESHYVLGEINFAISKNISVIPVFLEDVTMPSHLELLLGICQSTFAYQMELQEVRRKLHGELPQEIFHKVNTPFFVSESKMFFYEDTSVVFPENTAFAGEELNSFRFYWQGADGESNLLWQYQSPGGYDMSHHMLDCQVIDNDYCSFDSGMIVVTLMLNFMAKYPVPWPTMDICLRFAVVGVDEGTPRAVFIHGDHNNCDGEERAEPFIEGHVKKLADSFVNPQEIFVFDK